MIFKVLRLGIILIVKIIHALSFSWKLYFYILLILISLIILNLLISPTVPVAEGMACALADSDEPFTIKRDGAYKIQFSGKEGELSNTPALSVEEFIERSVKKHPTRVAMKVERDGKWISWTYKEYLEEIKTAAKAFIKVC